MRNIKVAMDRTNLNKRKSTILSIRTKRSQNWQGQQVVPQGTSPSVGQQASIFFPFWQSLGWHWAKTKLAENKKNATKKAIPNNFENLKLEIENFIYYVSGRSRPAPEQVRYGVFDRQRRPRNPYALARTRTRTSGSEAPHDIHFTTRALYKNSKRILYRTSTFFNNIIKIVFRQVQDNPEDFDRAQSRPLLNGLKKTSF